MFQSMIGITPGGTGNPSLSPLSTGGLSAFHPVTSPFQPTPQTQAAPHVLNNHGILQPSSGFYQQLQPVPSPESSGNNFLPPNFFGSPIGVNPGQNMDANQPTVADGEAPGSEMVLTAEDGTQLCSICHDRATGKHYGAHSCDGCKGFFRRTIRRHQQRRYACRFQKQCVIDKDQRNSCRYCRFQKCLLAGMKQDAVQMERDRIFPNKKRKSSDDSDLPTPKHSKEELDEQIQILQQAEEICAQMRSTVITRTDNHGSNLGETVYITASDPAVGKEMTQHACKLATVDDVAVSMHQQLLLMVEWAKTLQQFYDLHIDDQVALLRNYSAQHLLFCAAYRSRHFSDVLLLTNETCIIKDRVSEIPDINHVTTRVVDELIGNMKLLRITEEEYVCLKAIIFFNPLAKGLKDNRESVKSIRDGMLAALEQHLLHTGNGDNCRFANLLLLLPSLQAIAQSFVENLQLAELFGMAHVDNLLQELLFSDGEKGQSTLDDIAECGSYSTAKVQSEAAANNS